MRAGCNYARCRAFSKWKYFRSLRRYLKIRFFLHPDPVATAGSPTEPLLPFARKARLTDSGADPSGGAALNCRALCLEPRRTSAGRTAAACKGVQQAAAPGTAGMRQSGLRVGSSFPAQQALIPDKVQKPVGNKAHASGGRQGQHPGCRQIACHVPAHGRKALGGAHTENTG